MFIKKKQHRVCRYPSSISATLTRTPPRKGPTLYPVDLYPFAHIHHLDERSFVGCHWIIFPLLLSNASPVICYSRFGLPSNVL